MKLDIESYIKNTAAIIGLMTTIIYGSGYLALHARAYALGLDPSFTLVDEVYIFAGFRFLYSTLIIVLLELPVILLTKNIFGKLLVRYSSGAFSWIEWGLMGVLGVITIFSFMILSVNGVLLVSDTLSTIQKAVLGTAALFRLVLIFAGIFVAVISFLLLMYIKSRHNWETVTIVAVGIVFIQLCLLPVYHGALFADRKARVLATVPQSLKEYDIPVAVIGRSNDQVTIVGKNDGHRTITTIKAEEINGIAVEKIVPLYKFVSNDLEHIRKKGNMVSSDKNKNDPQGNSDSLQNQNNDKKKQPEKGTSVFSSIASYLNMTLEAIGSLGGGTDAPGQLWEAELDKSGNVIGSRRIGSFDNLKWPVISSNHAAIFVLQNDSILKIDRKGTIVEKTGCNKKIEKLLGVIGDSLVFALIDSAGESMAVLIGKSSVEEVIFSSDENKARSIALLSEDTRTFAGKRVLSTTRSRRGGLGFDVFFKIDDSPAVNISDGGSNDCHHPSISPDFKYILYIKTPRN